MAGLLHFTSRDAAGYKRYDREGLVAWSRNRFGAEVSADEMKNRQRHEIIALLTECSRPAGLVLVLSGLWAFGYIGLDWHDYVRIDPRYFRPTEVELLLGDPSKAKAKLGWQPKTSFRELVTMMVKADYDPVIKNKR